jgi:hypothetical protein
LTRTPTVASLAVTLPLEPGLLRQGSNRIELLSDTEHHGIEILPLGPAIVVRARDVERGGRP